MLLNAIQVTISQAQSVQGALPIVKAAPALISATIVKMDSTYSTELAFQDALQEQLLIIKPSNV